jgi:hypothetical protein
MPPAISPDLRRAHLASMQAMLDAERGIKVALLRSIKPLVKGRLGSPGEAFARSRRIEEASAPVLLKGIAEARGASHRTLGDEFAVIRKQILKTGTDPFTVPLRPLPGQGPDDIDGAHQLAKEIGDAYKSSAERIYQDPGAERRSAASALPLVAVETVAITAGATAFAEERRRIERRTVQEHRGTNWLPGLLKLWDSTLDVHTCLVCERTNGQLRPWGIDFKDRGSEIVPAKVHRRCRCVSVSVFSVLYLGRDEVAKPAA